ncbi:MAG: BrxE family protein [Syntrophomonas sp.]|nr:BrxE family protein [Syntrophomonas sp.]
MKRAEKKDLIRLRFIVGYLGEQLKPAWWNSSFFAPGSTMFLAPIFSKTTILAQYHGLQEAASKIHDERIGIGTSVFHLFRLPDVIERELHYFISDSENMGGACKRAYQHI